MWVGIALGIIGRRGMDDERVLICFVFCQCRMGNGATTTGKGKTSNRKIWQKDDW